MIFMRVRDRGFTAAEIIVVVAIIAVLSTIVWGAANAYRKSARDTERKSDIGQLQIALRLYKDATGVYPPSISNGSLSALNVLVPDYLPYLPNDPLNQGTTPGWAWVNANTYYYWGPGNVGTCGPYPYTLWYRLESKTGGTAESCVDLDDNSFTVHP